MEALFLRFMIFNNIQMIKSKKKGHEYDPFFLPINLFLRYKNEIKHN